MKKLSGLLLFCLWPLTPAPAPAAQDARPAAKAASRGAVIVNAPGHSLPLHFYDESHALVIGMSKYRRGWGALDGVNRDVELVTRTLERHRFRVHPIRDAGRDDLVRGIRRFVETYGAARQNRILVYFAGHGFMPEPAEGERPMGYIVPADAPTYDADPDGFRRLAISMDEVRGYARLIRSKHALFVLDSCRSGSLIRTRGGQPPSPSDVLPGLTEKGFEADFVPARPSSKTTPSIDVNTRLPVREFITSGTYRQDVPDDTGIFASKFADALSDDLTRNADDDQDFYVTGSELGRFLHARVASDAVKAGRQTSYGIGESQLPQFLKVNYGEHGDGDFVFETPGATGKTIPLMLNIDPGLWKLPRGWIATDRGLSVPGEAVVLPRDAKLYSYLDCQISAVVRVERGTAAAFVVRARDESNYYLVRLSGGAAKAADERYRLQLQVVRDGRPAGLAPKSISINERRMIEALQRGKPVQVEIVVYGSRVDVKLAPPERDLPEKPYVFDLPEDVFPFGTVGFRFREGEQFKLNSFSVVRL